jgi:hemerythrin superfamily protein
MICRIYDSEMIGFEILTLWVLQRISLFITQVKWHNIHEDETYFPKWKKIEKSKQFFLKVHVIMS